MSGIRLEKIRNGLWAEIKTNKKQGEVVVGVRRECVMCGKVKKMKKFYHETDPLCRLCANIIAGDLYDNSKQRLEVRLRKYGLTEGQYKEMKENQNHSCAICNKQSESLVIDHCHKTGKVRGLLCNGCNWGLGHFRDNESFIAAAGVYVRESKAI